MSDSPLPPEVSSELPPQNLEEALKRSNSLASQASDVIANNLKQVSGFGGDNLQAESRAVTQEITALKDELKETTAAFENKLRRLNSPYMWAPELAKVQEVAEALEKPLLLEGEPGTGKTSLAYSLAGRKDLPIIQAQCKSTTTAQQLLYTIDEIGRFRDAQAGKDVSDLSKYVRLGPLGKAFSSQEKVILLVDEVDKAKREFTNDLLHELDQMSFMIPETGQEIAAKERPIVIITSNHEKDLPEPVLRRCVYNYIEFPSPDQMTEIVKSHLPDIDEKLLDQAIEAFYRLRETAGLEKKPSTSEMLDWAKVMMKLGVTELPNDKDLPFLNTLIKSKDDFDTLERKSSGTYESEESESDSRDEYFTLVKEAQKGRRIVALNMEKSKELYLALANNGFVFEEGWNSVDIHAEGIKKVMNDMVSIDPSSEKGKKLLQILAEKELARSEFAVSPNKEAFAEVDSSSAKYVRGKDSNGFMMLRTPNDQFIVQVQYDLEPVDEREGTPQDANVPMENLDIKERWIESLKKSGINTVSDLIKRLNEEDGGQSLISEGFGQAGLVTVKKLIREGGYRIMDEGDTTNFVKGSDQDELSDEALLGESTLAKMKPNEE